nr:hypothetical protein [Nocardioides sp.]
MTPVPVSGHRVAEDPVGRDAVHDVPVRGDVRRRVVTAGHERVVQQCRGQVGAGLGHQPREERRHRREVGAEVGIGGHQQLAEVPVEVGQAALEGERLDALLRVPLQHDARVGPRIGRLAGAVVARQRPTVVEPARLLLHLTPDLTPDLTPGPLPDLTRRAPESACLQCGAAHRQASAPAEPRDRRLVAPCGSSARSSAASDTSLPCCR